MSLLLRNRLYIGFGPDQVSVLGMGRGLRPKVIFEMCETVNGSGNQKPWQDALERLAALLDRTESGGFDAKVVLSDRLAHYATVVFDGKLKKYPEQEAYARHMLSQLFGQQSAQWDLRIAPGKEGKLALVSGVELTLLDGLRKVCADRKVRLRSIKPRMMAVVNRFRKAIAADPVWLVISEQGFSFIALIHDRQVSAVNGISHASLQEIPVLLDRENLISALPEPCKRVVLYVPGVSNLNSWGGYEITSLTVEDDNGLAPSADIGYSMAWDGVL